MDKKYLRNFFEKNFVKIYINICPFFKIKFSIKFYKSSSLLVDKVLFLVFFYPFLLFNLY